jgi:Methylmalonic aciduria and homocystinuria type D protein
MSKLTWNSAGGPAADVPRSHVRDIQAIFPDITDLDDMVIVPTCQRSKANLLATGEAVDREKDELLEAFVHWAQQVCDRLKQQGHWCDYIDPCSGLPVRSHTTCITHTLFASSQQPRRPAYNTSAVCATQDRMRI